MEIVIGIVVLNYRREELTIRCVKSLALQQGVIMRIVIVDNASDDEEYSRLIDGLKKLNVNYYNVIRNTDNLGFARGMNLGIDYLRKHSCNYIFLANSDLVFENTDILFELISESIPMTENPDSNIAIINPFIVNPNGEVQEGIHFSKTLTRLHMWKTQFPLIDRISQYFKTVHRRNTGNKEESSISCRNYKNQKYASKEAYIDNRYKVVGCGFVLTPAFFKHFSGLFAGTFLYNEEYTTILLLKSVGLQTMTVITNPILHIHAASTSIVEKNTDDFQKRIHIGKRAFLKLLLMTDAEVRRRYDIKYKNMRNRDE